MHEHEHNQGNPQQHRNQREQASDDVLDHLSIQVRLNVFFELFAMCA